MTDQERQSKKVNTKAQKLINTMVVVCCFSYDFLFILFPIFCKGLNGIQLLVAIIEILGLIGALYRIIYIAVKANK